MQKTDISKNALSEISNLISKEECLWVDYSNAKKAYEIFAEAMKNIESRIKLADCVYTAARSTGDVTIRNTGYMLSDELRTLETISLHRIGDFYEMYGEEAKLAANILELQLTYREINGVRTDMVGIPYHVLEKYVAKLEENNILVIFLRIR
mgnify:CR=1 FL=1